jgi:hypothetical protein
MSTSALQTSYHTLLRRGRLSENIGQAALVRRLAQLQVALTNERQDSGLQGLVSVAIRRPSMLLGYLRSWVALVYCKWSRNVC